MPWDPGRPSTATARTPLLGEWNHRRTGVRLRTWRGQPRPVFAPRPRPPRVLPDDPATIAADAAAAARNRLRRSLRG